MRKIEWEVLEMKKHIVCFGDSNTHGYFPVEGGLGRFNENERWTCLLQKHLGEDYLVIEEGLSGRTTSFEDPLEEGLCGLTHMYTCLMTHEPVSLLIIMLGTNDAKERFGSNAACIALGMKRLIQKAQSVKDCWADGKPNILLITPQNMDARYIDSPFTASMGRGCAEKTQAVAAEYKAVAELTGCEYLDANQIATDGPNTIDYMHLTKKDHSLMAEAISKKILEIGI